MADPPDAVRRLLERAADTAGPFDPPPLAALLGARPAEVRRPARRGGLAAGAAVAVVVSVAIGLAVGDAHRPHATAVSSGSASPSPSPTASPTSSVTAAQLRTYQWSALPAAPIQVRQEAATIWTGTQLIVWGGVSGKTEFADGAAYTPATRTWTELPPSPLSARDSAQAVWVDGRMVIWGDSGSATDGAAYDPSTRQWTMLPPLPALGSSYFGGAQFVSAGREATLFVLPDRQDITAIYAVGYDPGRNQWHTLPTLKLPSGDRPFALTALGAGNAVYLWTNYDLLLSHTGNSSSTTWGVLADVLAVGADTWASTSVRPAQGYSAGTTLWTGSQIVLASQGSAPCGACTGPLILPRPAAGTVFDLASGQQRKISAGPLPEPGAEWFWTGNALLGVMVRYDVDPAPQGAVSIGDAASWDPDSGHWTTLTSPSSAVASALGSATMVWAGDRLLAWPAGVEFAPPA